MADRTPHRKASRAEGASTTTSVARPDGSDDGGDGDGGGDDDGKRVGQ